jgi:DMSO/TMAO reductase YedYZ molybdopterin-dependent catalytic subunit
MLSRRAVLVASLQAVASLVACTVPLPPPLVTPAPPPTDDPRVRITPSQATSCVRSLPTIVPPTPIPYPGFAQQEPETGLHVTTGALPVTLADYRLLVIGRVDQPLSLTYDDLRCLPKVEAEVRLECPGYFVDTARLAGPTLASVLALAAPQPAVTRVTLTSVNGYDMNLSLEEARAAESFLAYEWRG